MADQLQIRGGDTASNSTFTGAQRELSVDTVSYTHLTLPTNREV